MYYPFGMKSDKRLDFGRCIVFLSTSVRRNTVPVYLKVRIRIKISFSFITIQLPAQLYSVTFAAQIKSVMLKKKYFFPCFFLLIICACNTNKSEEKKDMLASDLDT